MYYFDANVFIFPQIYDLNVKIAKKAKEYLFELTEGNIDGCTATLTWDEIVHIVRKRAGLKESSVAGKRFLNFPNLRIINVDNETIGEAQKITEKYGLKPRDAIHAACAIKFCNGKMLSNDSDFDVVEKIKRES